MQATRTVCLVAVLAGCASAQGQTWIVDVQNGPGTQFTDIPPAIAAAADGDTIVIRAGTYSPFSTGKALNVLGEGDVVVQNLVPWMLGGPKETLEVTGLAAGKTFVAKNLRVEFVQYDDGVALTGNQGRIHFEDVSVRLFTFPAQFGTGCVISSCRAVTWGGGQLDGRPATSVYDSTVDMHDVALQGGSSCGAAICASWGSSPAMVVGSARVWLSHTDAAGGSVSLAGLPGENGSEAIFSSDTDLTVTGDAQTRIFAGGSPTPIPAIRAMGGTVTVDTTVVITGAQGGADISGTAAVVRRRVVALRGHGAPPGGMLTVTATSAAGDLLHLLASVPADPTPLLGGTLWLSLQVTLPLYVGAQSALGSTSLSIPVPNAASLRGEVIAMQTANFHPASGLLELSNPVVAVLN